MPLDVDSLYREASNTLRHYSTRVMAIRSMVLAQGFALLAGAGYLVREGQMLFVFAVAGLGVGLTWILHKLLLNYWRHFETVLDSVVDLEVDAAATPWKDYKEQRTSLEDLTPAGRLVVHGPFYLLYFAFVIVAGGPLIVCLPG